MRLGLDGSASKLSARPQNGRVIIYKYSNSFINVGIAEQNMVGIATGLSLENKKVYIYSINNFLVFRALEQIRYDICYHNLDVKIVTVGTGFDYGTAGYSHFGIEDISI